jgi:hypothetical protein
MIKTIDTNEIPDEMLYAGVYAAERCSDAGITDLKDVVYEAIFSALEVAPAVEPAQSAAGPVSKEWDSLSSIGNRLHNISVEQHYAGNEKLSNELGEFASLLWIWDRTRKPTVPPAIVEQIKAMTVYGLQCADTYRDVVSRDDLLKILEAGNDL